MKNQIEINKSEENLMQDWMNRPVKKTTHSENNSLIAEAEKETEEMNALADSLENSNHNQNEDLVELVDQLRQTADFNPLSETSIHLKEQAYSYLR